MSGVPGGIAWDRLILPPVRCADARDHDGRRGRCRAGRGRAAGAGRGGTRAGEHTRSPPPPLPKPLNSPAGEKSLLPAFPCRLLWSPRKPWGVESTLSAPELGKLFEAQLTASPTGFKRMRSYHRQVRWDVQRNAVSGQLVATCRASGLIGLGLGSAKVLVDVSGDTLWLDTDDRAGGRTEARMGVGRFTTWNGLYAYPATSHTYDFVKAVKSADRSATVSYPWSIFRIITVALVALYIVIALIASAASGSGNGSAASTDTSATDSALVADATPEETATPDETEAPPEETATPDETEAPPEDTATPEPVSALPDEPRSQMRDEIAGMLRTWHQDIVDGDPQGAWDLMTQRKRDQSERKYGFEEWARGQATLAPYLDPSGLSVAIKDVDDQTGVVTVDVRGMGWSKPGAHCSSWSGITWVRYEDGDWHYDPGYSTTPQRERAWKSRFGQLLGGSC